MTGLVIGEFPDNKAAASAILAAAGGGSLSDIETTGAMTAEDAKATFEAAGTARETLEAPDDCNLIKARQEALLSAPRPNSPFEDLITPAFRLRARRVLRPRSDDGAEEGVSPTEIE